MSYVATRKGLAGVKGIKPGRRRQGAPVQPHPPLTLPTAWGRGSLGDIICLEGDCKSGTLLVQEMQAVFKQLSGAGKDELNDSDIAFMRRFGQTVTQTIEQFQAENAKLSRQIPFSLVCCTIKELGRKAQDLTRQMREFRGIAQTTPTPVDPPFTGPGADFGKGLGTLFLFVGAALAAVIVLPSLTGKMSRQR